MITKRTSKEWSYDYSGATYYLEGLLGGIPYQQRQIQRLQRDLDILHEDMYSQYHSPSLNAWDTGVYQKNRYSDGHNRVIDFIDRESRITAKIKAIQADIQPIIDFISDLSQEESDIVEERYWEHQTLDDIGVTHAMSRESVRRCLSRILLQLEHRLFTA